MRKRFSVSCLLEENEKEVGGSEEVMTFFQCIICNQYYPYLNVDSVSTLWNDPLFNGKPICEGCGELVKHLKNYNYGKRFSDEIHKEYYESIMRDIKKTTRKLLDKWLK